MSSDLLDLSGHTVMITGGAGALGRPVCALLSEHGARVAVVDLADEETAGAQLGTDGVHYVRADLTAQDQISAAYDEVGEKLGTPDIVCCHAGIVHSGALPDYPLEHFDAVQDVNLRSNFAVASEAARRWIANGTAGHLIFTGSWVQDVPWPGVTAYAASKAAVRALARGFARELAPHGIRANTIAPGIVNAGMARKQWDTEPDYRRRASKAIPLGYLQPPESVAHAVLFLCSPMAAYMTGSTILSDGGASLYPMDEDA